MQRASGGKPLLCVPTLDGLVKSPQPTRGARVLSSLPGRWSVANKLRGSIKPPSNPHQTHIKPPSNPHQTPIKPRPPQTHTPRPIHPSPARVASSATSLQRPRCKASCSPTATPTLSRSHASRALSLALPSSATHLRRLLPPLALIPAVRFSPPFPPTQFHNSCRARRRSLSHHPPPQLPACAAEAVPVGAR